MSYDLAVFDPRSELRGRAAFIDWYESRTMWADGLDYNEPSNASASLQAWFREAIEIFPPLNGRLRPADFASNEWTADYAIGADIIFIAFPSEKAGPAYELTRRLAAKHGLGFFDASGNAGAWFPAANGYLELVHIATEDAAEP